MHGSPVPDIPFNTSRLLQSELNAHLLPYAKTTLLQIVERVMVGVSTFEAFHTGL